MQRDHSLLFCAVLNKLRFHSASHDHSMGVHVLSHDHTTSGFGCTSCLQLHSSSYAAYSAHFELPSLNDSKIHYRLIAVDSMEPEKKITISIFS
uniref:Uncharacterized protein n=1 Tax=Rhipicephalus zambeziensis TaxID=60191 RepID=A0A224Y6Z9_9ACAR